jgi:uncharacterized protein YijF (DUF1287 family)
MAVIRKIHSIRLKTVIEFAVIVVLAVCIARSERFLRFYARHAPVWSARATQRPKSAVASLIVDGARTQIGSVYDCHYVQIAYPGGDVPSDRGACSDVVVRALRNAGIDLQQLIHEDMLRDFNAYPHLNSLTQPDANIDHRRALIQMRFFERHGKTLPMEVSPQTIAEWQPGDFVYWQILGNYQHAGVLSDRINANSLPLVIHNGSVCIEQNCLTRWKIIGHFRFSETDFGKPATQ